MVSDFEELRIYQESRLLAKQVYEITRKGELTLSSAIATRHSPKKRF